MRKCPILYRFRYSNNFSVSGSGYVCSNNFRKFSSESQRTQGYTAEIIDSLNEYQENFVKKRWLKGEYQSTNLLPEFQIKSGWFKPLFGDSSETTTKSSSKKVFF